MTRKRARKILMSIGTSRNHANWGLTAKPRWKTNAGVVEDTLTIKLYAKLLRARMEGKKRAEALAPEERTLDFPVKYTEICALYHFYVDLGIKCTIEHLYDGYAVRFPDGSDFAQHHGTYGGTEGCVEPAIGDSEFDYTAVGLNLAKELVKKHKGKLEADKAERATEGRQR